MDWYGRYETTYDPNSEYERYKREREKINIALWDDHYNYKLPRACKSCSIVLIPCNGCSKSNGKPSMVCKGCGEHYPVEEPKKEAKPKLKQRETGAGEPKFLIASIPDRKIKRHFGVEDTTAELSDDELVWIYGMFGNVVSTTEG